MLLQRLAEYGRSRISATPRMYKKTAVPWIIDIDRRGEFLGFVSTFEEGDRWNRGTEYLTPHIGRSSAVRAKLFVDTGEYVLGIPRSTSRPERIAEAHRAFTALVEEAN